MFWSVLKTFRWPKQLTPHDLPPWSYHSMHLIQPPTHLHRPHTTPSTIVSRCVAWVCADRGMLRERNVICLWWYMIILAETVTASDSVLLRKWSPTTDAQDGLCLMCKKSMLWARGGGDRFGKSMWPARSREGSRRGLSFTHDGVGFHPNGRWRYTSYSIHYSYGGAEWSYKPHIFPTRYTTVMRFLQEHWRATGSTDNNSYNDGRGMMMWLHIRPRSNIGSVLDNIFTYTTYTHTPPIRHWISTWQHFYIHYLYTFTTTKTHSSLFTGGGAEAV